MKGPCVALLLALAAALAPPASGRELWRRGDAALDFSGSLRELVSFSAGTDASRFAEEAAGQPACLLAEHFAECPAFGLRGDRDVFESLTRLRTRFDLALGSALSATVVYDHELRAGFLDRFPGALVGEGDTFFGAEDEIHAFGLKDDADHRRWRHALYRGSVRYRAERLEITLGRQRIPWGVGRLWNPIDRFNAIGPLAIEADQSQGIDALDARWNFSGFSYLQAVYAPGTRSEDARYALRFQGVVRDTDLSLMAGVFERARTVGVDLARNLGEAAWRLEAVFTNPEQEVWLLGRPGPEELSDFWQVVVSADVNLDVGSGIYLLVEHLYDGNALGFGRGRAGSLLPLFAATDTPPAGLPAGIPSALEGPFVQPIGSERFGGSRVISLARHTTGLQLGYDLHAVVRGDLLALYDWNGQSAAFFPTLRFTGFNDVELSLGAQLFVGADRSQFGASEHLVFLLAEVFF